MFSYRLGLLSAAWLHETTSCLVRALRGGLEFGRGGALNVREDLERFGAFGTGESAGNWGFFWRFSEF